MGFLDGFLKIFGNSKYDYEKEQKIDSLDKEASGNRIAMDEVDKVAKIKAALDTMRRLHGYLHDKELIDIGEFVVRTGETSVAKIKKAFPDIDERIIDIRLYELGNCGVVFYDVSARKVTKILLNLQEYKTLVQINRHEGGLYDNRIIKLGRKFSSDLSEDGIDDKAAEMLKDKLGLEAEFKEENVRKVLSYGSGIVQRVDNSAYSSFVQLLLSKCMPSKIRFILSCPGREFSPFDDFPQLLIPSQKYLGLPESLLSYLDFEIALRRQRLANYGVSDYIEYNKKAIGDDEKILPYMLLFEELSRIPLTKDFKSTLENILLYGKICGISVIGFSAFNASSLKLGRLKSFLFVRDADWCLNIFNNFSDKESDDNVSLDYLSGEEFEEACAKILNKNGFKNIQLTPKSGDYGGDILAEKDQIKYVIQCKRYNSSIGVSAVQEVIASRTIYKCHVGVVLTNNYFTKAAEKLADENNIILWNRDYLNKMAKKQDD